MSFRPFRFTGSDRITNRTEIIPSLTERSQIGQAGLDLQHSRLHHKIRGGIFSAVHPAHQVANGTQAGRNMAIWFSIGVGALPGASRGKSLFSAGKSLSTVAKTLPTVEFRPGGMITVTAKEGGFAFRRKSFQPWNPRTRRTFSNSAADALTAHTSALADRQTGMLSGYGLKVPFNDRRASGRIESASENVGQASSLTVAGAFLPRVPGGRMPPEPADKMSAPHFQTASEVGLVPNVPDMLNLYEAVRANPQSHQQSAASIQSLSP